MSSEETIGALLAGAGQTAAEQERREARIEARVAWVKARIAALKAAHKRVDEAWARIFDALPDDIDDDELEAIPPPAEQAEVDSILAELAEVRDHDRWPRELYWSL